jgi:hypothetical protein
MFDKNHLVSGTTYYLFSCYTILSMVFLLSLTNNVGHDAVKDTIPLRRYWFIIFAFR